MTASNQERAKAMSILARSLFKDLAAQGYSERDVVALATALLGEVTDRDAREQRALGEVASASTQVSAPRLAAV